MSCRQERAQREERTQRKRKRNRGGAEWDAE